MFFWFKFHKKSKETSFLANVREITFADSIEEAEAKLKEVAKEKGYRLCSLLHGPYGTEHRAKFAHR